MAGAGDLTGNVVLVTTANGGGVGNSRSDGPVFSPDGKKVLFQSDARNLVPGDTNAGTDVFIKDLATGLITRLSVGPGGVGGDGSSTGPVFSPDGTKVAFLSTASNLVLDDGAANRDLFIADLATGVVTRIALAVQVYLPADRLSFTPDGGKLLFLTGDALSAADTNGTDDLYVVDLATGVQTRLSTDANGNQINENVLGGAISPDGTKILFQTTAALSGDDQNHSADVYVKDLATGAVTLVARAAGGAVGDRGSKSGTFSPDGTKVAFWSSSTNLVPNDNNASTDLFVKDLVTGAVTLVTSTASGVQANLFSDQDLTTAFSPDGNFLLFTSLASNLVPGDTNTNFDVFVKDLRTGAITRVSTAADGTQANYGALEGVWSPDGRSIAFYSGASNLVNGVTPDAGQLFVKDVSSLYPAVVNHAPVANADTYSVIAGAPFTLGGLGVLANDIDPDGDPLSAILVAGPSHGTLSLDPTGAVTYTPQAEFHGADTFTYKANDGKADSATTTVTLVVDRPPTSRDDTYSMKQDNVLTITGAAGVLANDDDPDGDPLAASLIAGPQHGTLSLATDGAFTYTPAADFRGSDSFTYRASDGIANGNVSTVALKVYSDAGKIVRLSTTASGGQIRGAEAYAIFSSDGKSAIFGSLSAIVGDVAPNGNDYYLIAQKSIADGHVDVLARMNNLDSGASGRPSSLSISNDGKLIAFSTDSGIFVENLTTLATKKVVDNSQIQLIRAMSLSPDGRKLAYNGYAQENSGSIELYITDVASGKTEILSRNMKGQAQDSSLTSTPDARPVFSQDGNLIAFYSDDPNMVADDTNRGLDLFVKNLTTGTVTRVSTDSNGIQQQPGYYESRIANGSTNFFANTTRNYAFSHDGRYIAFFSSSPSLNPTGDDRHLELYLKDLQTGELKLLSTSGDGTVANEDSYQVAFSPNDDYVAFSSRASNLVPGGHPDPIAPVDDAYIYIKNIATGAINHLITNIDGGVGNSGVWFQDPFYFSPDGSQIIFRSSASNLVSGDTNNASDIFIKAVHYPPSATSDAYAPPLGKPFVVSAAYGLLKNDQSPTGNPLSAVLVSGPTQGNLDLHSDGSFTYTPPPPADGKYFTGEVDFTYKSNDGISDSNIVTVKLQNYPSDFFNGGAYGGASALYVGDPHLVTFDGHPYDFQAAGEFTAVKGADFEIQVRQTPLGSSASVIGAVAMSVDGISVSLYVGSAHPLLLGGVATDLADGGTVQVGTGNVSRNGHTYTVVNGRGDGFYAVLYSNFIDLKPMISKVDGGLSGLLGNADGLASNDFRLRDGTQLGETLSTGTLYSTFADSWRITDATSLFSYAPGESTATFTDRSFPHATVALADLDPTVRAAAEQTARDAGLTPGTLVFNNAVLDIALTGRAEFATAGAAMPPVLPGTPTVALLADTGVSAGDGVTSNAALILTPRSTADRLNITVDGLAVASYDPALLSQGRHTVSVTETNVLGYTSQAAVLQFTRDTMAPDLAVTGGAGRSTTSDVVVSGTVGTADAGQKIEIYDDQQTLLGTTLAGTDGHWSLHLSLPQMGDHPLVATAMDIAGNVANTSFTVTRANDSGSGLGDVHMVTFQGRAYDFQAVGRFTLVQSVAAASPFDIEIETSPFGAMASVTTGIAAQVGANAIRFDLDGSVWINGAISHGVSSPGQTLALDGGALTRTGQASYRVDWSGGESLSVSNQGSYFDEIVSLGPTDGPNSVKGLLGRNTSRATDIALADGTVLENPSEADLLGLYAQSWSLPQSGSLLDDTVRLPLAMSNNGDPSAPFNGHHSIGLANFDAAQTTLAFEPGKGGDFGTLTMTSARQQLALVLMGQYAASDFHASSDGHGGTIIDYQAPQPSLLG